MNNIFKGIGRGILYVIGVPIFFAVLALYAVFGIFVFLVMFGKWLYCFFSGRSLKDDLPEDVEAKKIIEANTSESKGNGETQNIEVYPNNIYNSTFQGLTIDSQENSNEVKTNDMEINHDGE